MQDYETFTEQLNSLGRWIVEAGETLKGQDPCGSTDLSFIEDRMSELKVRLALMYLRLCLVCLLFVVVHCLHLSGACTETDVKVQQHVTRPGASQ